MVLQISFLTICYPVLILTYLGQTAWLTAFPDQVGSTFYASIPFGDGFYWVSPSTNAWCCLLILFFQKTCFLLSQEPDELCLKNLVSLSLQQSVQLKSVCVKYMQC